MTKINFANILESTVNRLPNQLALITEEGSLTYEELYLHVNSLARGLMDLGIKQGNTVACLLPNGLEIVTTHFAAAKIGATLVPLNHYLKPPELQILLKHSGAMLLIAHSSFAKHIMALDKAVIEKLIIIWAGQSAPGDINFKEIINSYPRLDIYPETTVNELCSILYTSGTTGNPKGVMRTHENNYWAAINMALHIPYKPGDLELFLLPMSSIGFFNIFAPNIIGGSTVLIQEKFEKEKILKAIDKNHITRIYLAPPMWDMLISNQRFVEYDTSSLEQLLAGSAPMPVETKIHMNQVFSAAKIYEIWGMTEGGLISLGPEKAFEKLGSIGKPIHFNEAKIVDEQGFKVTPGMVGEIVIRGKSVMTGYYKSPEENNRCFNEGWFHTADMARYDDEGYIYLVGRKSDMIIFGDNKVYPKEVEEVLLMHPHVIEAAAFGLPNKVWGEIAVAVVVKQKDSLVTQKELNDFMEKYIANYKKPKFIFFSDELPRTATGKIIKNELKKIYIGEIS